MAALALLVVFYAVSLLLFPEPHPPFLRERAERIPVTVFVHLAASAVALAIGPFSVPRRLTRRWLELHRWMGRCYLVSVFAGGSAGLVMATMSQGGMVAHVGFGTLALCWIFSGLRAYQRIVLATKRNIAAG